MEGSGLPAAPGGGASSGKVRCCDGSEVGSVGMGRLSRLEYPRQASACDPERKDSLSRSWRCRQR